MPDYIELHETARHTLHSSETLAMALETLHSMMQEQEDFSNRTLPGHPSSAVLFGNTRRSFQLQSTLLKSIHLRSQGLEKRIRNEINLVGHLAPTPRVGL
jgi:hypothetical protein